MNELTINAKIAVLRILKDIATADQVVHEREVEYLNQVAQSFGFSDEYQTEVDNIVTLQALSVVRELTASQKTEIAKLMGKMIVIDEDINYNEVKLYNAVCESCNIEKDFHVEDYPDYTLSGPFVNPEDMLNSI